MTNYYDILGVKQSATISEIKTAFRTLAKIYHPDKNPAGQEDFKKILRAYETLINPGRRSSYDMKLKYHQNSAQTSQANKTKNWSFDEKELKRRQYYNDHIKKYEKVKKTKTEHAELKKNYNEYKYILYATPIAVALFLLVIHFATPSHRTILLNETQKTENISGNELKMGDAPYTDYFGPQHYTTTNYKILTIKNNTGSDIIVCLFSDHTFLRSCVIKDGYYAEIPQLPSKDIQIKYEAGQKWDGTKQPDGVNVAGAFTKDLHFYKSIQPLTLGSLNEITIIPLVNEGFREITQQEFFNKENI